MRSSSHAAIPDNLYLDCSIESLDHVRSILGGLKGDLLEDFGPRVWSNAMVALLSAMFGCIASEVADSNLADLLRRLRTVRSSMRQIMSRTARTGSTIAIIIAVIDHLEVSCEAGGLFWGSLPLLACGSAGDCVMLAPAIPVVIVVCMRWRFTAAVTLAVAFANAIVTGTMSSVQFSGGRPDRMQPEALKWSHADAFPKSAETDADLDKARLFSV